METLKLFLVGVVQGVTELLPVSSTAHILLLGKVLTIDMSSVLLISFHLGTTIAILIFFWKKIFTKFFSKKKITFLLKIILSSIPAGLVGLLFEDLIAEKLRAEWVIAVSLIVWGVVMIVLESMEKREEVNIEDTDEALESISWKQSLFVGISQIIALIPGTSRSGITTIAGVLSGLNKYVALEFSFLIGLPILFGSFLWVLIKTFKDTISANAILTQSNIINSVVIFLSTYLFGYITLTLLKKFRKSKWLTTFGIYRIILGIIILIFFSLLQN